MPFTVGFLASFLIAGAGPGLIVAAETGSTVTGVIAGVAGTGILGGVGVQLLRLFNKSNEWTAAQVKRHVEEIERLGDELERERTRNERLEAENARLRRERERR